MSRSGSAQLVERLAECARMQETGIKTKKNMHFAFCSNVCMHFLLVQGESAVYLQGAISETASDSFMRISYDAKHTCLGIDDSCIANCAITICEQKNCDEKLRIASIVRK